MNGQDYAACVFAAVFIAALIWLCITATIGILWLHCAMEPVDPLGWPMGVSLVIGFAVVAIAVFFERKLIGR